MDLFRGRAGDAKEAMYDSNTVAPTPPIEAPDANGTGHDGRDMYRLGKRQQFQRNFRFISILGFTSVLMCTWEGITASASLGLVNGGLAGMVWTFLATILCFTAIIASMADMASMAPTTGGQYHWVSEFAPKSKQKFLSYLVGWTAALGWQSGTASTAYISATVIQGLFVLNNEDYSPTRWQGTLLIIAVALIAALFNTYLARHLPLLEGLILLLHVLGFFAVLIPLWVLAPRNPAPKVFGEFYNGGGWPSMGTACIVGQLAPVFSFLGPDAAVHMAEEVRDASRIVPRCMISTVVMNGVMGFIMIITLMFCVTDIQAALDTSTGYPFIEVFYAATNSKAAATGMSSILVILFTCCCISNLATASRQSFAFARDNGLPFSASISKVTKMGVELPLNAVALSLTITIGLALVNIGSTAAFNSIVGLLVAADFSSYGISIACILLKRLRGEELLPSRWSMGKLAIPVNILAVTYIIFTMIMSFFPTSITDLTAQSMNWSSLVFSVVVGFAIIMYFVHGRHVYHGPVINVRKLRPDLYEGDSK